jgi:hypothetical protein
MKIETIKVIFCSIVCSMILLLSCAKDGDQGPPGSKGEQGTQGETGAAGGNGEQGAQGSQGETGTANVIYSDWFSADFGENPILSPGASDNFNVDEFTQEIKDNGLIIVYSRRDLGQGYSYFTLPYTRYFSTNQHFSSRFFAYNDRINISVTSVNGSDIISSYLTEFRYIIVPGGIPASGKNLALDYKNLSYQELCNHFNIPQ